MVYLKMIQPESQVSQGLVCSGTALQMQNPESIV
jgi:hypothetical protein